MPAKPRQDLTEQGRRAQAAATGGLPLTQFDGTTPYEEYVHAGTLHGLQGMRTSQPGEMAFLVITQVMELYFGLICHELEVCQRYLRADRLEDAVVTLRRTAGHLEALNASWAGLRWMSPSDFHAFRDVLGQASGFQSFAYRKLEFLLGIKQRTMVRPHRSIPRAHRALLRALKAPSVYDDALAALSRRGYPGLDDMLGRDLAEEYVPSEAVETTWVTVYRDEPDHSPVRALAEAMIEIAQLFHDWRYRHLTAVRRTMGERPGSGGSAGAAWLERARPVFPELWSARTLV